MKKVILLFAFVFTTTFLTGQLLLDVEGDGVISGSLGLGTTQLGAKLHLLQENGNPDILLTRTDNFGLGSNGKIWQSSNALNMGYQQLSGDLTSQINFFSTAAAIKSDAIFFRPNDACEDNGMLDLSITIDRSIFNSSFCVNGEEDCAPCSEDFIALFPESITAGGKYVSSLGKSNNRWSTIYGDRLFGESLYLNNNFGFNTPSLIITSSINKWDLASGNGDFMIGNNVHHLEMAMSTDGAGAGNARIQSDGGTGNLILGSKNNDILTVQHDDSRTVYNFDVNHVKIEGNLFVNGTQITSDGRFKKDIEPISKALKTIQALNGVSYHFKTKQFEQRSFTPGRHLGLIAQEIETVLPELVKTQKDGYKSINYDGLIPVLIEATKAQQVLIEQQAKEDQSLQSEVEQQQQQLNNQEQQIKELKQLVEQLVAAQAASPQMNHYELTLSQKASLSQNYPNPFNQHTLIDYFLPANTQTASIQVTAIDGKLLGTIPITEKGAGRVTIKSQAYPAGTYFYSLVIDGQIVTTKQMVLSGDK